MKYYMGLDLSLTGTGIVVIDENSEVVVSETIKNDMRGMQRLEYIKSKVSYRVGNCDPVVICIEDYAMGIRVGQTFSIGELGGVIKLYLYGVHKDPVLVSPTKLKKFVTGKGVADKDIMMMYVFKNFGFEAPDNNQADAYGLAKMAQILDTEDYTGLTKLQIEAVYETLNPPDKKKKKKVEHDVAKPRVKKNQSVLVRRS